MAGEVRALEGRLEGHLRESQAGLHKSLDALGQTLGELRSAHRQEAEQRRVDIEHLAQGVAAKIDETREAVDDEKVARLEREAQILKRTGEDVFRLQEKIDSEALRREEQFNVIQATLSDTLASTQNREEQFRSLVLGEVATLKNGLQVEVEERQAEDEQIVLAINAYTKALKDGLRIVNK